MELLWLVVIGTSIWVAVDASNLGARRGVLGGGFFDIGVAAWFFCCLLLWIVGFPAYLVTRSRYLERKRVGATASLAQGPAQGFVAAPPAHPSFASNQHWEQPSMAQPLNGASSAPAASTPAATGSLVDELSRLSALRDSGALTQAEFDRLKAQMLDSRRQ